MSAGGSKIEVISAGALSTVQDLGRRGSQRYGVSVSGVLDFAAAALANRLVGNPVSAAVLETAYGGAELRFNHETRIAVTGADLHLTINQITVPIWETLIVPKGAVIRLSSPHHGVYSYLAVAGGIDVPMVLASRSTHLASGMGGIDGRAVQPGGALNIAAGTQDSSRPRAGTSPPSNFDISYCESDRIVRAVKGPQYDSFDAENCDRFWNCVFRVSSRTDRQGMRLEGAQINAIAERHDIVSDPAYIGAVQVPGDGMPIVLLADRQPTGGYTKIASVIRADLPKLVQKPVGSEIQFQEIDIETSEALVTEQHRSVFEHPLEHPVNVVSHNLICEGLPLRVSFVFPYGQIPPPLSSDLCWVTIDDEDDVALQINADPLDQAMQ